MSDIVSTLPWWCGDDGHTWHKASYWLQDDGGASVDEFSDGDHEDIDEDELPTPEREVKEWADYRLWALKNRADPLDEFVRGIPASDSPEAELIRREAGL